VIRFYIITISLLVGISLFAAPSIQGQTGTELKPKSVPRTVGVDESSGNSPADFARQSELKEQEVNRLVMLYRSAATGEKAGIRQQIYDALNALFEINLRKREAELQALEAELEDVRRGLYFRQMNKKKIVEGRLKELLGDQ
jgi:hypothetical protein